MVVPGSDWVLYTTPYPWHFDYWKRSDGLYHAGMTKVFHSVRYNRYVEVKQNQVRDGASGARDIISFAWWVHDQLCADGVWANGDECSRLQAAMVLHDILREEGYWFRAKTWGFATWLLGCKKVRKVKTKGFMKL